MSGDRNGEETLGRLDEEAEEETVECEEEEMRRGCVNQKYCLLNLF